MINSNIAYYVSLTTKNYKLVIFVGFHILLFYLIQEL